VNNSLNLNASTGRKSIILLLWISGLALGLLSSCSQSTEIPATATKTITLTASPSTTVTASPTTTPTPTKTPTPTITSSPTPTATPQGMISDRNCRSIAEQVRLGTGFATKIGYLADGESLWAATNTGLLLYDTEDLSLLWQAQTPVEVISVGEWSDVPLLIALGGDYRVMLIDKANGALFDQTEANDHFMKVAISPDGETLAAADFLSIIGIYTTDDFSQLLEIPGPDIFGDAIYWTMEFSPNSKYLATGAISGNIRIYRVSDGYLQYSLEPQERILANHLIFSEDGRTLAVEYLGEEFEVHIIKNGRWGNTFPGELSALSADGTLLATLNGDEFNIWNVSSGDLLAAFSPEGTLKRPAVFSEDLNTITINTTDGTQLWDWETPTEIGTFSGPLEVYTTLAVAKEAPLFAAGSYNIIEIRSLPEGTLAQTIQTENNILVLALSPDGNRLASAGETGISIWDTESGELLSTPYAKNTKVLAFSPDGNQLALISDQQNRVEILDVETGSVIFSIDLDDYDLGLPIEDLTFSNDGRHLAAVTSTREIPIWIIEEEPKLLHILEGKKHLSAMKSITFSPFDDAILASQDNTVVLWEHPGGSLIKEYEIKGDVLEGGIGMLSFSPSGEVFAVAYGNVIYIRRADGSGICEIEGHHLGITDIAFSQDGRYLISLGEDGTIRIWGAP
jgi:WD40 repeat protein